MGLVKSKIKALFKNCQFCIHCVYMSLTWTIDLKVIPLCVNKKGKVTVKVHLSLTDYPKVTQETGMFYTEQDTWSTISDLVGCSTPNCAFLVPVSTKIYFNADLQNFRIGRPRTDAVFLFIFSRWFETFGRNEV